MEAIAAEKNGIPVRKSGKKYKVNSGWLIEQCGLKGKLLHGFRVSDKAALVLINESASGYSDLAAARNEIQDAVRIKFGMELWQEPVEIGPGKILI
jgi:UDP-N-acetylmuramate dehydrogenase